MMLCTLGNGQSGQSGGKKREGRPCTSQFAQPDLDAAGDDGVGEVVQAKAGGNIQRKPADHEGHEEQQRLGKVGVRVLIIDRRRDDGR